MATYNGVNATKIAAGGIANILDPGASDGRVKCFQDTYEASAVATGSTIAMGPTLPTGARIIDVELMTDALGAGRNLSVGDAESAARYISATTCNTANLRTRLNAIDGFNYEIDMTTSSTPDNQILITTSGTTSATGTIKLTVYYVND